MNSSGYDLGMREDRTAVCDVELPVWAKKPEDFVRINRMVRDGKIMSVFKHPCLVHINVQFQLPLG